MIYGYARVSRTNYDIGEQMRLLRQFVPLGHLYDVVALARTPWHERPLGMRLEQMLVPQDVIYVASLSALFDSVQSLVIGLDIFLRDGVQLIALDLSTDPLTDFDLSLLRSAE